MKRVCIFTMALLLLAWAPGFAANNSDSAKRYFENILHAMSALEDWQTRPNPNEKSGAERIITVGLYLVYNTLGDKLEQFNKTLPKQLPDGELLVPAELVEKAICRYFGFNQANYGELVKAASKIKYNAGYYRIGASDPGYSDFRVDDITLLKNGLLSVSGVEGEDMEEPQAFTALFQKTDCGGKEHWVLLNYTSISKK